jgi:hypothetical protein
LTERSKREQDTSHIRRFDLLGASQKQAKISTNQVSYGYQKVAPEEKRRLVDQQFDAIARWYDLADSLLSFGLDSVWRRLAIRCLNLKTGDIVLDLCGGTADLAMLAARDVAPEAFKVTLEVLGFSNVVFQRLTNGIAVVYLCEKGR